MFDENSLTDLPEDRSTVLLLGVTRIPTSPVPARRPCTLPLDPPDLSSSEPPDASRKSSAEARRSSFLTRRQKIPRRSSSSVFRRRTDSSDDSGKCASGARTSSNRAPSCNENASETVMDRSVDSIGTCSLDVETSADMSDWSEASSGGTLRSASLVATPSTELAHLPSYLSLACTVNGYSTTINYDPVRLARSRDASPHRLDHDHLTPKNTPTYCVQNNLLSPPYLVPLPTHIKTKMAEHALAQHQTTAKTLTFQKHTAESHFTSNLFGKDATDACFEHKRVSYESKSFSTAIKECSNGTETKSFIQQRVERLYGRGALAQGFFVTTRQKHNVSDPECGLNSKNGVENGSNESSMKQSNSSPALPVLRHLRPEFRAQLPIVGTRKSVEATSMQKSNTVPVLKDEVKTNGHSKPTAASEGENVARNIIAEESGEKDGHYFLIILQNETGRLLELAENAEKELVSNTELSEDVVGKIHSASGKARLLVTQKMQQFKGLCTNNITQSENEAFPTTNEDLQGFWDMVMLQVAQVDALFREIEALKANNWQELQPEPSVNKSTANGKAKKLTCKVKPVSIGNEEARKKHEALRKQMIEERRKAMKSHSKPLGHIEIFVPESS